MESLEEKLKRYKEPSSLTEKDKQERAERMVRDAIASWPGFRGIDYRILLKGSYANNTNVKADSDVDIAVVQLGSHYYDDADLPLRQQHKRAPKVGFYHDGAAFRNELEKALKAMFGDQCETSGKTAIAIRETSSRVSIDVVPSFAYRKYYYHWYFGIQYHDGTTTRRIDGSWVVNYPEQQLQNGRDKNQRTRRRYKPQVRIMKRIENDLVASGRLEELPSYFMECLVYNVPDEKLSPVIAFSSAPLTSGLKAVLRHVERATAPGGRARLWREPNGIKRLFADGQPWSMGDARKLVREAQDYYNLR